MAEWKNGKKILHVGLSGLQYRKQITTNMTEDVVSKTLIDFYSTRKAHLVLPELPSKLNFTRGSVWLGRLACLLPLSETWPFQTISTEITTENDSTILNIVYDVRMFFSLVVAPNAIEKEASEIQRILETKKDSQPENFADCQEGNGKF